MSARPVPEWDTPLEQEHWDALQDGRLTFQRSGEHAWLPPRSECPATLSDEWVWETASGEATLISWVTYHRAYHAYFANKIPYSVAVVELAEGPRMLAPVEFDGATPAIDAPLRLEIERDESGVAIPVFHLVADSTRAAVSAGA